MDVNDIVGEFTEDEVDVILDPRYPFPDYELEITWKEWDWNAARTERLEQTVSKGMCINPVDFAGKDGNIDFDLLKSVAIKRLRMAVESENRASIVEVLA